jgi:hypothetical protein
MPVLLDVTKEAQVQRRDLSAGVPLILDSLANQVVMTKYISNSNLIADWQPAGEWFEQVVVDTGRTGRVPRITVAGMDGQPRGVTINDGLIIDLIGTMAGLFGILPGQPPMDEEQVADFEAATEKNVPMFQRWDFRIKRVLKTNGPEARESLAKSEDQKRQAAQTEMFDAFTKMFQLGSSQLAAKGELAPTAQAVMDAAMKSGEATAKGK